MKLSAVKNLLPTMVNVAFELENGISVPAHFHVTEIGVITKHFIDCGGTERLEKKASFQLWDANDFDHRLEPTKLLNIIELAQNKLGLGDLEIEVEYQGSTIEKYDLDFNGSNFVLVAKQTNCLALDLCGIPQQKISALMEKSSCTPGGGCC